ncbi:MAG: translation initiation factor IF-2 [Candidatus Kapabacteria bacterium]|nr:translation initiation factor IF-2 [Candidatus Kapabacteria bacterium]
MAGSPANKLFKVASTLNIGREEIVEFLQSKGFDVENKPTTSLTDEMVTAVSEHFSSQAKTAEKQRDKVQKLRSSTLKSDATVSLKTKEKERQAEEAARVAQEKLERERILEERKRQQQELEDARLAKERERVEQQAAEQAEIAEQQRREDDKRKRVEQEQAARDAIRKAVSEHHGEQLQEQAQSAEPLPPVEPQAEQPETSIPAAQSESASDAESHDEETEDADGTKRKRKRKKNIITTTEPGQMPQLRGLTVVGKIDIRKQDDQSNDRGGRRRDNNRDSNRRGGNDQQRGQGQRTNDRTNDRNPPITTPIQDIKLGSLAEPTFKRTYDESSDQQSRNRKPDRRAGGGPPPPPQANKKLTEKDKKKVKNAPKVGRSDVSEADVARAIRETLSGMDDSAFARSRSKIKQRKRLQSEEREQRRIEEIERESGILRVTEFLTTAELANFMGVTPAEIITKCFSLGLMVSINQRLDKDTIQLIADDYGYQVEFASDAEVIAFDEEVEDSPESLLPRSPIVTIMGHVDHGKTSLLDYIRNANVVAGEAGGITQHIGAYKVVLPNGKSIAFLDTPGHEAFTAMRARGAQITDIVVLVVAADDNVMPQTLEAISHAQAANVPIVVAINKIDKEDARPDNVRQQLANNGVLVEEWGGKYQCTEISAKKGINIEQLLDKILLEADLLELKANADRTAYGTVIEAHVDKGKGNVVTVMVQKGTLRIGDEFLCGQFYGRVRSMYDERGNRIEEAGPSTPAQVTGFEGLPESGDTIIVSEDGDALRDAATQRQILRREQQLRQVRHITLDDISAQIQQGGVKELRLVIKTDVSGSLEALTDSLLKLSTNEVKVNIIYRGVGSISESDIMLAAASDAVVIGFQVLLPTSSRRVAEREAVDVRLYSIIYDAINEVELALEGMLSPEIKEETLSRVEVRQVFKISKVGAVAGCYVTSGVITRNDKVRILRNGFEIYKGTVHSLKHVKDDVKEIKTGFECGITVNGFNDYEEGDVIVAYKQVEVKRKLN